MPTRPSRRVRLRVALTAAVVCAGVPLVAHTTAGADPAPGFHEQLPDLTTAVPFKLSTFKETRGGKTSIGLAFGSAGQNEGAGPIIIVGHRANRKHNRMAAAQYIDTSDGTANGAQDVVDNVGVLHFVVSKDPAHKHDHRHWHLLRFETYALRRASDGKLISPDHKTGFCLGNRAIIGDEEGLARAAKVITYKDFDGNCGHNKPGALSVIEGISPGNSDPYHPKLEGQSVDITHAASGQYVLSHTVNPKHSLRESNYENNSASVLIALTRRSGGRLPTVKVLARCPGALTCAAASG
jgi:Lysyl oxidase